LRRLATHYHRMVKDRTRVTQRMKALFLEMGVPIPRGWRAARRISLRGFRDASIKQVARAYSRQLDMTTELVSAARDGLLAEARRHPSFELLQTIPYIGKLRAAELIAVVGTPARFSVRRFWAYGGLAVTRRVSGEHKIENGVAVREQRPRGVRLSANCQPRLKRVLKDIALQASLGTGPFREVYEHHLRRGKQPSIARLALARKVAAVVLAVWRSGTEFRPSLVRTRRKRKQLRGEHQSVRSASRTSLKARGQLYAAPKASSRTHRSECKTG
jgi:hypothetical protein